MIKIHDRGIAITVAEVKLWRIAERAFKALMIWGWQSSMPARRENGRNRYITPCNGPASALAKLPASTLAKIRATLLASRLMIAEQPTRKVLQALRAAGWSKLRDGAGSHTIYGCHTGKHDVSVPDGHRTISPGVARTINKAVASCDCPEEEDDNE